MAVRRGDLAKEEAKRKIIDAFGGEFAGEADKKLYVNVRDGASGEIVQLAISMTMPKTALDFGTRSMESTEAPAADLKSIDEVYATTTKISDFDRERIEELKRKLNIV